MHFVFRVPFSILSLEDQITEISEMGILLIVKVICDWLRCNPNLVVSIGQVNTPKIVICSS